MDKIMNLNNEDDFFAIDSFEDQKNLYATIHKNDLKLIEKLELAKYNAFIAGGAALKWYQNLPVENHDIDIWFTDKSDMMRLNSKLLENGVLKYSSDNAETYEFRVIYNDYRVQLIKNKFINSPEELINTFDITVCQVATDGNRWWIGKDFIKDVKNKRLRFSKMNPNSPKRLIKYMAYGYQPDSETLNSIVNNSISKWEYKSQGADEYDHVI